MARQGVAGVRAALDLFNYVDLELALELWERLKAGPPFSKEEQAIRSLRHPTSPELDSMLREFMKRD